MPGGDRFSSIHYPADVSTLGRINDPFSTTRSVIILAVLSILCFLPALLHPPVPTGDLTHHLQITSAYQTAFADGTFLPDFAVHENSGYGSVTVRFYPPLMHITIALIRSLVVRSDVAIFLAFSFWSFIGAWGAFLLARELFGSGYAPLVAGVLLTISPYHLNQFYNSFMWGEFVSLSVLPFVFLFLLRVCKFGGFANITGLATALAAIILSNIPQAVISVPCLSIFALFCLDRGRIVKQVASMLAAISIAGLGTAFYWVRVATEMKWIQISLSNFDPAYDYRNHFLFNSLDYDVQGAWFGSVILLLTLSGVAAALISSGGFNALIRDRMIFGITAVLVFSAVMTLPVSKVGWDNLELLQRIQFPWRFLSPLSLMSALLIALAVADIGKLLPKTKRSCALVITGTLLIFTTFSLKQVILSSDSMDPSTFNRVAEASVSAQGLPHWWPVSAGRDTFSIGDLVHAGGRSHEFQFQSPTSLNISVSPGTAATVRISKLYYPLWQVSVNGQPAETRDLDGALAFNIGPEASHCQVMFEEPWYSVGSRYLSGITALVIFSLLVFCRIRRSHSYE